jgi:hypothetical protein
MGFVQEYVRESVFVCVFERERKRVRALEIERERERERGLNVQHGVFLLKRMEDRKKETCYDLNHERKKTRQCYRWIEGDREEIK